MSGIDLKALLSAGDVGALFDRSWYIEQYADLIATGEDPLDHYTTGAAYEGRDPHPLFDSSWYLQRNPDVAEAGTDPLAHYLAYGAAEGRDPHPLFDTSWYLDQYEDVAQSGINPLAHYVCYGAYEGRDPHPLFDSSWYLEKYPDVAEARVNPLTHYIHCGVHYGTEPHPLFNGAWYRRAYNRPDLDGIGPLLHFVDHGAAADLSPSPYFSAFWYRKRYLAAEAPETNPLIHYLTVGQFEGYVTLPIHEIYTNSRWIERNRFNKDAIDVMRHLKTMVVKPHFYVIINADSSRNLAANSLASQVYRNYSTVYARDMADHFRDWTIIKNVYILWLEGDDRLHREALYTFAGAINQYPEADLLYGDEEIENANTRTITPFYKPCWSPDYLESFDYIGRSACYKLAAVKDFILDVRSSYDLNLRASEDGRRAQHIRKIVLRNFDRQSGSSRDTDIDRACLEDRFQRTSRMGRLLPDESTHRNYHFYPQMGLNQSLTVVVYNSVPNLMRSNLTIDTEINFLKNFSVHAARFDCTFLFLGMDENVLLSLRVRWQMEGSRPHTIGRCSIEDLNDAEMNFASPILMFCDVGIRSMSNGWLEHMVKHAAKPAAAAVGGHIACIQSARSYTGVVIKNAQAQYIRAIACTPDLDYAFSTSSVRNFPAISHVCMLTKTSFFKSLGGIKSEMDIIYGLIDYCVRCTQAGYWAIYEPLAKMDYFGQDIQKALHESLSKFVFARDWETKIFADPFYNHFVLCDKQPHYEGKIDPALRFTSKL